MNEIKLFHHVLFSLEEGNEVENWEVKLSRPSYNEYYASAVEVEKNLSIRWTKLNAKSEANALEEIQKLIKVNHK